MYFNNRPAVLVGVLAKEDVRPAAAGGTGRLLLRLANPPVALKRMALNDLMKGGASSEILGVRGISRSRVFLMWIHPPRVS